MVKVVYLFASIWVESCTPETTKFDRNLNTNLSCHNFFLLSSEQIFLIPACCLLCVPGPLVENDFSLGISSSDIAKPF